jgi:hypothetical protein
VAEVMRSVPLNLSFHRPTIGDKLIAWQHMITHLINVHLCRERDVFIWVLQRDGQFSVHSMYKQLMTVPIPILENWL